MIGISGIKFENFDADVRIWNTSTRVGLSSQSDIMDIKLVQWYMFVKTLLEPSIGFSSSMITGFWNSSSQSALVRCDFYEQKFEVSDGVVDPFPEGQIHCTFHHKKFYKLVVSASDYYEHLKGHKIGAALRNGISGEEISDVVLNMFNEIEMPNDLSSTLQALKLADDQLRRAAL